VVRRVLLAAGVCCGVALAGVGILTHDDGSPASAPVDGTEVVLGRSVHVESGVRGTRFLPLGPAPVDGRTLSAQHAYNAMLGSPSLAAPIPADLRAYYGVLTDTSPSPMAKNVRVWGFAVVSGCLGSLASPKSGEPTSPQPVRCRHWEFVNARTGLDLGVITQEVLPG
jgi:hypothetical protein